MTSLPGKPASFWIDSTLETNYPTLINDVTVDVAIVGGGIAGITAAMLLKNAGKSVAVVEAKSIATGVSGHTTAKVTSLHQLIYADLIKEFGEDKARIYAESNQAGVEQVADLVAQEGIDCDFSRQSTYTFADSAKHLDKIEAECEAALKVGLPASFVTETSLPFAIAGAVKVDNQAQFHVRKYLLHLADKIAGEGSYVFENSRVEKIEEGTPCEVITSQGKVKAQDVIVATNLPILDQGLFFAKSYPKRSYIIGAAIDPEKAPEGMFIGVGDDYHSIRTTPYQGGKLLLIGGGGHKVGAISNTEEKYLALEAYGRSQFGIDNFDYRWSSQDMVSFDKLPYIGKLTPANKHIYVATGFSLWGMSKGTMAGMLLKDLVLGQENSWADLYEATRATPFVTKESLKNNAEVGLNWIGDRLKALKNPSLADVGVGEGKIVLVDKEPTAVYKDEQGKIHAVSPVCTHLACIVNWNSAEKSWDCPCHGARFTCEGQVIQGPAIKNLEKKVI